MGLKGSAPLSFSGVPALAVFELDCRLAYGYMARMNKVENWKPTHDYGEYYEVSDLGRVRNKRSGHILSQTNNPNGYPCVSLSVGSMRILRTVHRLVAIAFLTPPSPLHKIVHHKDGNRSRSRVDNLAWVTPSKNVEHACVDATNMIDIPESVIEEAKRLFDAGHSQGEIADHLGISRGYMSPLLRGVGRQHCSPASVPMQNNRVELKMSEEVWKECAEFPYADISSHGRVRRRSNGKVLKPVKDANGYIVYAMMRNNKAVRSFAHRLVAFNFLPPHADTTDKWVVNHVNGCRSANFIENLEWVTHRNNMRHHFGYTYSKDPNPRPLAKEDVSDFKKSNAAMGWLRRAVSAIRSARPETRNAFIASAHRLLDECKAEVPHV